MAASGTWSYEDSPALVMGRYMPAIFRVTCAWVSDGAADPVPGACTTISPFPMTGFVRRVVTVPDGAPTAPTLNYDIALTDVYGQDLTVTNLLINRHNVNTESVIPIDAGGVYLAVPIVGTVQIVVTAAGNDKGGTVHLFLSVLP